MTSKIAQVDSPPEYYRLVTESLRQALDEKDHIEYHDEVAAKIVQYNGLYYVCTAD